MSTVASHNANNLSKNQKVGIETTSLAIAELVSMGVSLGVVAIADQVAPEAVKTCSKALGKAVFEPYLDYIEAGMSKICKLDECQADQTKSREERAETLAKTTMLFGAAWVASFAAKLATRSSLNKKFGLVEEKIADRKWWQIWKTSTHEKIILGMDEGVHYGSLIAMNTVGAKYTDEMIRGTESLLTKLGFSKQKAHEMAAMTVVWELPNFLGLLSGIGGISGIHHKQWDQSIDKKWAEWFPKKSSESHVDHLAQQSSVNNFQKST